MIGIALLQGVNIGKHKRIRMADFKSLLASLGLSDVVTLVNSGNAVFRADNINAELEQSLTQAVSAHIGMDTAVVVRAAEDMANVVANNPFPEAAADTKTLHLSFCRQEISQNIKSPISAIDTTPDQIAFGKRECYLFAPNKLSAISKGTQQALKILQKHDPATTSRNWNTVTKLSEIAAQMS